MAKLVLVESPAAAAAATTDAFSPESVAEEKPKLELGRDGGGKFNFSSAVDKVLSEDPGLVVGALELAATSIDPVALELELELELALSLSADDEAAFDLAAEPELEPACAKGRRVCE